MWSMEARDVETVLKMRLFRANQMVQVVKANIVGHACSIVKICVIDQVWIEVFDVHSIEVWDGDHDRNKEGDCQICEAQG